MRKLRPLQVLAITLTGIVAGAVLLFVVGTAVRVGGKSSAPHAKATPRRTGVAATPIAQLENHTCGLLSLSAAYVAYGLSPEAENLRFRLGTDREAVPGDGSTTGTLHPDLLRVLVQDGFGYWFIDPETPDASTTLRAHLADGGVALILIVRRESGGLHWVMSDAAGDDAIRVVDSLAREPVAEPVGAFLRDCVVSIIAIEAGMDGRAGIAAAHADGIAEMARVRERMKRRD